MFGGQKAGYVGGRGSMTGASMKRILFILALVGVILFALWSYFAHWAPDRGDFPVQGVSVSPVDDPEESDPIDWAAAHKAGVDFAYIIATEGTEVRHPGFASAIASAEGAGIDTGAMHIYNLCRLATDQAGNFIQTVERSEHLLPSAVQLTLNPDCKDRPSRDALMTELATYLNMVEAHMGKPVILKFDQDFDQKYQVSSAINRPFWLERRFLRPDYAARGWALWQSSPEQSVAGFPSDVQWSVARPDQKQDRKKP